MSLQKLENYSNKAVVQEEVLPSSPIFKDKIMNRETLLSQVAELVKAKLKPLVDEIDRNGLYPEDFMHELGAIGGFGAVGTEAEGGNGLGLATQIAVLREVGKECGATSFSAWCQAACAWYLHQTPNQAVKDKYLADILQGKVSVDRKSVV